MNPKLNRRFPDVAEIEKTARRRLPAFLRDYVASGIGQGQSLQRNRAALEATTLLPRYSLPVADIDIGSEFLGRHWQAPFGIAPVGLGSFVWPQAAETLALEASNWGIPFTASTFALSSLEKLKQAAGDSAWFQLYRPNKAEVESDLVGRAIDAGFETLMVTVDIPGATRRAHDIRNGFIIPPRFDAFTLKEIITHPRWSLAQALHALRYGMLSFETLDPYTPDNLSITEAMNFRTELTLGSVPAEVIADIRKAWPGKLIVKGVLDPEDALAYRDCGADAILVSNHGGRQLEAAPATIDQLRKIRRVIGPDYPLLVDGGVRSGIDICRMLASGADFVLLGRPFYFAMAAIGQAGAAHIIELLIEETRLAMTQLGCANISELAGRLHESD